MKKAIILLILTSIGFCDWIFGPEGFDDSSDIITSSPGFNEYWYAPTYRDPLYVYSPGFESDSCIGSGEMSWTDWWGNFIRTPLIDCSEADSVILTFRMWNTGDPTDNDNSRFYIWVEPGGYMGTVEKSMGFGYDRDWELMNIDFTEFAAGESQVFFYLEANFGTGSFERECKFDNIGVMNETFLDIQEEKQFARKIELRVSPNPFNKSVTIDVPARSQSVEIYDIKGKLIEKLPDGRNFWMPNKSIKSGTYLIRSSSPSGNSVCKPIVYIR